MLKPVIAAAAVIALAGSSIVYAQQGPRDHQHQHSGGWGPNAERHHRPSAQDMAAFTDARIAALKAGLELTPDQAKNWPAFEQALRDMAQLRVQRMQARAEYRHQDHAQRPNQTPGNPFDRLTHRADNLAQTSAALKKVADAGAPLYQSLSDEQKARFARLSRMLRPHQRMQAFNQRGGDGGGWRHEHHRQGPDQRG